MLKIKKSCSKDRREGSVQRHPKLRKSLSLADILTDTALVLYLFIIFPLLIIIFIAASPIICIVAWIFSIKKAKAATQSELDENEPEPSIMSFESCSDNNSIIIESVLKNTREEKRPMQ